MIIVARVATAYDGDYETPRHPLRFNITFGLVHSLGPLHYWIPLLPSNLRYLLHMELLYGAVIGVFSSAGVLEKKDKHDLFSNCQRERGY